MKKDMYHAYEAKEFEYCYPLYFDDNVQRRNESEPTYMWDYGDSVKIPFRINPPFNCKDYTVILTVYNFRYESIYKLTTHVDQCSQVYFTLTCEESRAYFPKGIYFCGVQACMFDDEGSMSENTTILQPENCSIYVG